jgi:hypothetical protein
MSMMSHSIRTFQDSTTIDMIKTLNSSLINTIAYDDRVNTLIVLSMNIPFIKYRINGGAKKIDLHKVIVQVLNGEL